VQSDNEINVDFTEESKNETKDTDPIEAPIKKREKKARERCTGCNNQFKSLVDCKIRLCYTCDLINESVHAQVKKNGGSVEILYD